MVPGKKAKKKLKPEAKKKSYSTPFEYRKNEELFHRIFSSAEDCFDPRERFQTEQCLSGTEHLAREELEIYGVVACCPRWTKTAKHPKQPTTQV